MNEMAPLADLIPRSVFRVQVPNITPAWNVLMPLFQPIFDDRPTHTAEDVRLLLMAQQAQLWIQWNQDTAQMEAAFVTEFAVYPRGIWVRIWLGAAQPKTKVEYSLVRAAMTEYARTNGCRGFEVNGRHGWIHKFPEAKVEGLAMRVTFE
jgi:hypothetical protein